MAGKHKRKRSKGSGKSMNKKKTKRLTNFVLFYKRLSRNLKLSDFPNLVPNEMLSLSGKIWETTSHDIKHKLSEIASKITNDSQFKYDDEDFSFVDNMLKLNIDDLKLKLEKEKKKEEEEKKE